MFFNMNGAGPRRSGPVDTTLYELLEVPPTADENTIKQAYRRLAKEHHPDKNPADTEKFKEISFAHEVLTNPQKRQIYDAHGLDGLKEGGHGGGMFADDVFSQIFGGGGGMGGGMGGLFGGMGGMFGHGGPRRRTRGQDTLYPLRVTLEELYKGKKSKLQMNKQVVCRECNGVGGKAGATVTCKSCKGRGIKVTVRQLGPGMIQQMQSKCPECSGEGQSIAPENRCKKCKGSKTVKEQKIIEVDVTPGMRDGQRITLHGEGDQEPGLQPGDVVIVIQQKEHETFLRDKDDLMLKKTINLNEALTGFAYAIKHLDGRDVIIRSSPGDVIEPGAVRGIPNEGMPRQRTPTHRGNLYVKFDVEFPQNHFLDDEARYKKLEKILPARPTRTEPIPDLTAEHVEEVSMMPFEDSHFKHAHAPGGSSSGGRREAYGEDDDSDDDGPGGFPGGGQRVQCQQS